MKKIEIRVVFDDKNPQKQSETNPVFEQELFETFKQIYNNIGNLNYSDLRQLKKLGYKPFYTR